MYIHSCKINAGLLPPEHCGVEIGRKARGKSREREGERKKERERKEKQQRKKKHFLFHPNMQTIFTN